ncbi:hypothetical protein SDC9_90991 [bioreactor metagenome]|uniref:Uncharacterized protein n=1 Tax=bioreactor metagenome TaxID=1076179 RepID=A0A645A0E0_9ZZZZ
MARRHIDGGKGISGYQRDLFRNPQAVDFQKPVHLHAVIDGDECGDFFLQQHPQRFVVGQVGGIRATDAAAFQSVRRHRFPHQIVVGRCAGQRPRFLIVRAADADMAEPDQMVYRFPQDFPGIAPDAVDVFQVVRPVVAADQRNVAAAGKLAADLFDVIE